jgi:hypothetical protein
VGGGATAARGSRAAGAISPARSSDFPATLGGRHCHQQQGPAARATPRIEEPADQRLEQQAGQNTAASAGVIQALTP